MNRLSDTIAAIATPPGKGGIGIIRLSGPAVPALINTLFGGTLKPRYAHYRPLHDAQGELLDRGIALYFPAPHSYTGEAVLEWQGHGGPVVLNLILQYFFQLGARQARPGEFTERAFLNHKLDLNQAEAVIDLIESSSAQAARAAMQSLEGVFSQAVKQLFEQLVQLRIYIEATLDFPEEEIDFLANTHVMDNMQAIRRQVESALRNATQGRLLKEGLSIVILGQPNAGKSSLLNALAGRDSAIVTPQAGTTRDILREHIQLDGLPLHIVDTAGLRDSQDLVEQEGLRRAWQAAEQADRILLMLDDSQGFGSAEQRILQKLPAGSALDIVHNKIDLSGHGPAIQAQAGLTHIYLSLKTGAGLPMLLQYLKESVGYQQTSETPFSARQRHIQALQAVAQHVTQAEKQLFHTHGELAAEELRLAQQALNLLTGAFNSDDLLGEIFARFCIGK